MRKSLIMIGFGIACALVGYSMNPTHNHVHKDPGSLDGRKISVSYPTKSGRDGEKIELFPGQGSALDNEWIVIEYRGDDSAIYYGRPVKSK